MDWELRSIIFESHSRLMVIESQAFSSSLIQSISIPSSVEILGSFCFHRCKLLSSITFESNSRLLRIEEGLFLESSLQSILIPRNVEIFCSYCFSNCQLLFSITFESNSRLIRIESKAFSHLSLQSIEIPRSVQFIDGSAFRCLSLSSISLEPGNERFILENEFLINVLRHELIYNFCTLSTIQIPISIEILGSSCFFFCESLSFITFESNSRLTRIESSAFSCSALQSIVIPSRVEILGSNCFGGCLSLSSITFESNSHLTKLEFETFSCSALQSIQIPSSVEILDQNCFSYCQSLSSISFESNSRLMRIESFAFCVSSLQSIVIPSTILFVESDAVYPGLKISVFDKDLCPEFDRWLQLRQSGIAIDFRRIMRVDSGLRPLIDYEVNISIFGKRSKIRQCEEIFNEICCRSEDEILFVVKSISLSVKNKKSQLENEIENLINLYHPCIATLIGFVLPTELAKSGILRELKIVGLYGSCGSLAEVISGSPEWWTATAKAKAVVGIVLGLRFMHSHGLLHNSLNSSNIFFDVDHHIQIVYFGRFDQEIHEKENGGFSGSCWTPQSDIHGFASVLFEIIFDRPLKGETSISAEIPKFVSEIITAGLWSKSEIQISFWNIFDILRKNHFRIMEGVDSAEILAFSEWIESVEDSDQ
jgi:hypothetical protein